MIESDALFDQAENIFFELAEENLSEQIFSLLELNPSALSFEINDFFDKSWPELIYEQPEAEEFVEIEVQIALAGKQKKLAMILLSIDLEHNKECHIQWFG